MHMPDHPEIFTVVVDGEQWRETTSFGDATRADRVYVLDETNGRVVFGDGERGQRPKSGAEVVVTYRGGAGDVQVSVTTTWPPAACHLLVAVDGHGIHIHKMDPGVERFSGEKRVRYSFGQILSVGEFETEQQYHLRARYRHNKMLHGPGVVTGLRVEVQPGGSTPRVTVTPGYAIDREGHEVILGSCVELEIGEGRASYFVTIEYTEKETDWLPTEDSSEPIASRIEDGVRVRLAGESEKCIGLTIGRIVHGPSGWKLDGTFQPLKPC